MTALHEGLLVSSPFVIIDRPPPGEYRFGIVGVTKRVGVLSGFGRRTSPAYSAVIDLSGIVIGESGTAWHFGTTEPASTLGDDGDFYLRTSDKTVWKKTSGAWSEVADLSGADGATWHTGSGVPADSLGSDGDFYFQTSNATIYKKGSGTWTESIDIDGADGATWHSDSGLPPSALGEVGDFYFRTSNGFVYEKTAELTWTFRADITGPQGLGGADGSDGEQGPQGIPGHDFDGPVLGQVQALASVITSVTITLTGTQNSFTVDYLTNLDMLVSSDGETLQFRRYIRRETTQFQGGGNGE